MLKYKEIERTDILQLVKLFNTTYHLDKITVALMTEKLLAEKNYLPEGNFKVLDDNQLVGFASGFVRTQEDQPTGWIKLLAAADQNKLGPLTKDIFDRIEQVLIDNKARLIRVFDSFPNYYFPGIDPHYTSLITLVEQRGYFKQRDNVNMTVDLIRAPLATETREKELSANEAIRIQRASQTDFDQIAAFIKADFPLWIREVTRAFDQTPVPLHIAWLNNEVVAFAAHSVNNKEMGWFGPMGTQPVCRGKGLGGILLKRCLQDIKADGLTHAIIPWVGPIGFYFREVGAEVSRIYWNYRKEIKS